MYKISDISRALNKTISEYLVLSPNLPYYGSYNSPEDNWSLERSRLDHRDNKFYNARDVLYTKVKYPKSQHENEKTTDSEYQKGYQRYLFDSIDGNCIYPLNLSFENFKIAYDSEKLKHDIDQTIMYDDPKLLGGIYKTKYNKIKDSAKILKEQIAKRSLLNGVGLCGEIVEILKLLLILSNKIHKNSANYYLYECQYENHVFVVLSRRQLYNFCLANCNPFSYGYSVQNLSVNDKEAYIIDPWINYYGKLANKDDWISAQKKYQATDFYKGEPKIVEHSKIFKLRLSSKHSEKNTYQNTLRKYIDFFDNQLD